MADTLPVAYNVPDEVKEPIRLSLAYLIKLCPGWVTHLDVYFDSDPQQDSKGTLAQIRCDYRYRRVYLTIFPRWLWEDNQARKECIVHEAAHVLTAPVQSMVETAIKAMFKKGDTTLELFKSQWEIANESMCEDLSDALINSGGWGNVELEKAEIPHEIEPPRVRQTETIVPLKDTTDGTRILQRSVRS